MEKLAEVHWLDTVASAGWESLKDVNPAMMQTTGYVVYKDKEVIKIANTKDEKGAWFGIHAIPMACVKKIRPLSGTQKSRRGLAKKNIQNEKSGTYIKNVPSNNTDNSI